MKRKKATLIVKDFREPEQVNFVRKSQRSALNKKDYWVVYSPDFSFGYEIEHVRHIFL